MNTAHSPFERLIVFSASDLAALRAMAHARQAPKNANQRVVTDYRIMPERENETTHFIGLMGELAFSRALGVDRYGNPNTALDDSVYLSGNRIFDFEIEDTRIEVKTLRAFLAFRELSEFASDVAVLVIHDPEAIGRVWLQGWVTRRHFRQHCFEHYFNGRGWRYCLRPTSEYMQDIGLLMHHCYTRAAVDDSLVERVR